MSPVSSDPMSSDGDSEADSLGELPEPASSPLSSSEQPAAPSSASVQAAAAMVLTGVMRMINLS